MVVLPHIGVRVTVILLRVGTHVMVFPPCVHVMVVPLRVYIRVMVILLCSRVCWLFCRTRVDM